MNRRWWITIGVIIVVLIVIGVLHEKGMLNTKWNVLAMIFAALAGPYTLVKNWLFKDRTSDRVLKKYDNLQKDEVIHRKQFDEEILAREEHIRELDKKIADSKKEIEEIELRKAKIKEEVNNMSLDELQDEAINYFGD